MLHRRTLHLFASFTLVALFAVSASAQDGGCSGRSFDIWLNCEVARVAGARLNQQAPNKQAETPSIASNSTSLVDQTTAPDLLGIALNLAGMSGGTNNTGEDKTTIAFTTSAYALYSAFLQKDPLDPAFYTRHPNLRRLSFTLGQETPEGEDSSEEDKAMLVGVKYLIINRRDVSVPSNRRELEKLNDSLGESTMDFSRIAAQVKHYLYEQSVAAENRSEAAERDFRLNTLNNFSALHGQLTDDQLKGVRDIISDRIESRVVLEGENRKIVEKIRGAPQLAFTFQSKLRKEDGTDEHRAGLAFDYGPHERMNVTLNATFDYADSKIVGGDKRGARVAGEANFKLNRDNNPFGGVGPYQLAVSGESKWMSGDQATHTGQLKLTIPISDGISLPLSLSVANRSELVKETTVRGRFGFSFDFTKLFNGLR